MKHEDRLIDAIIDLGQEIKGLRKDMNRMIREFRKCIGNIEVQLIELNGHLIKLEKQQAITNIELMEMRLSYMKRELVN